MSAIVKKEEVPAPDLDEFNANHGQKPVETKAKKSIASFKVREGHKIGCKVTLRGEKMYTFMDNLCFA